MTKNGMQMEGIVDNLHSWLFMVTKKCSFERHLNTGIKSVNRFFICQIVPVQLQWKDKKVNKAMVLPSHAPHCGWKCIPMACVKCLVLKRAFFQFNYATLVGLKCHKKLLSHEYVQVNIKQTRNFKWGLARLQ